MAKAIAKHNHDRETKTVVIKFSNGNTYYYKDVPVYENDELVEPHSPVES